MFQTTFHFSPEKNKPKIMSVKKYKANIQNNDGFEVKNKKIF